MISFRFCPICGNPPGPQPNINQSDMTQAYDPSQNSPPNVFPQNNFYNNNYYQNNPSQNNLSSPHDDKSEFLAVILSFFIMGVGQMYTGRIARGAGILTLSIFLDIIFGLLLFSTIANNSYAYSGYNQNASNLIIFTITFGIGLFILWIWQMVNAHNLCRTYNQHLLQHGRPPW